VARAARRGLLQGRHGKITVAVSDDIDPDNADALLWSMAYRMNPLEDVQTLPHRARATAPAGARRGRGLHAADGRHDEGDMPPLALPKRDTWSAPENLEELGLPKLRPQAPWFGYSLGDWLPQWTRRRSAQSKAATSKRRDQREHKKKGVKPETKFRPE